MPPNRARRHHAAAATPRHRAGIRRRTGRAAPRRGRRKGRFDDAAIFDAIATVIDARAKPLTADDDRSTPERQAQALAEVCGYVLDHGPSDMLPERGGRRPHLNVIIRLEDLETRARSAMLDFGGTLNPASLRMLACDACVIPIVMNGTGQPLDVGRITRTIPDGLRRDVAARDLGCAHPGCGRPPSWAGVSLVTCGHGRRTARHQRKPAHTAPWGGAIGAPSPRGPARHATRGGAVRGGCGGRDTAR
ncbi:MAG: DUF222 domain-containing protein [Pseudonocardia sp.]